ncbi:MAG: zinc-dependent peptidase [Opitutales bacterium]|nr:zinc-dependent peptidase [Opitutales bacterium]
MGWWPWKSKTRLREARLATFQPIWRDWLGRHFPAFTRMPPDLRADLEKRTLEFLREKRFEGCGGLELSDEMIIAVAGTASALLARRPGPVFPELFSVLLYPSVFRAHQREETDSGLVHDKRVPLLGESWETGTLILAWDAVCAGGANRVPGQNIVLHEFAHQLDLEDGADDGAPGLETAGDRQTWVRVFGEAYRERRRMRLMGYRCVLDDYAATHPAEFFAVSTEVFFERPVALRKTFPSLYHELTRYFRLDPVGWESV